MQIGLTTDSLDQLAFDELVEGVRKYGSRIWHFHFKDHEPNVATQSRQNSWDYFESVQHGIFCELGKGNVDFPAVIKALEAVGYNGWGVVEQDVLPGMGSPKESAARNWVYLRALGL